MNNANGILFVILSESREKIPVQINRKRMKNCRLKVHADGSVSCSVPYRISQSWLAEFLEARAGWIERKKEEIRLQDPSDTIEKMPEIRDGNTVWFLGEELRLSVNQGTANKIYRDGEVLFIYFKEPGQQEKLQVIFERWWQEVGIKIIQERIQTWYCVIEKYGIPSPKIFLRKMKSLRGSCSVTKNKVTFNFYLLKSSIDCIDYVVLHELVHFIYPNHSKDFYAFLESYMPDWRERKMKLNRRSY